MSQVIQKIAVITGINGYIAGHIGLNLLEAGYLVRGTARSLRSIDALKNGAYKKFGNRFEPVEVVDIVAKGALDKAVEGAHVVIHTASPITLADMSWSEFRDPAINGTVGALQSALDHAGPQLQSVVVTSSVAAAADKTHGPDYTITEANWNRPILQQVEAEPNSPGWMKYPASKTAAELALWEWVEKNKPPFSVSCVNPSVVIGPPVQLPATPDKLNLTLKPVWQIFAGNGTSLPAELATGGFVDVRDIAYMHVWCAEHPKEAHGQRYLGVCGHGPNQAKADILHDAYPDRAGIMTKGEPGQGYRADRTWPKGAGPGSSGEKASKAMNFEYISLEKSVLDTIKPMEVWL